MTKFTVEFIALYSEVNGPERSYNDQFYVSMYMCVHCMRGLKGLLTTAYLQLLQSPTLYWVSTNPGQDSVRM